LGGLLRHGRLRYDGKVGANAPGRKRFDARTAPDALLDLAHILLGEPVSVSPDMR
jgi:hypothetical protein